MVQLEEFYKIFKIEVKDVCTPSDSYYARSNDWSQEGIRYLSPVNCEVFKTIEEAKVALISIIELYGGGQYTIIQIFQ